MDIKLKRWDPVDHLDDREQIVEYLNAALEDGDLELLQAVLGDIARAQGMTSVAHASGLGRESLYKALRPEANPSLKTINKVVGALGLCFRVAPLPEMKDRSAATSSQSRS